MWQVSREKASKKQLKYCKVSNFRTQALNILNIHESYETDNKNDEIDEIDEETSNKFLSDAKSKRNFK